MLTAYGTDGRAVAWSPGATHHPESIWIDASAPAAADSEALGALGLRIPSEAELSEVESSSRLRRVKDVFYFSLPVMRGRAEAPQLAPLGLILSADAFVTVRFGELGVLERTRTRLAADGAPSPGTAGLLVAVLETMIDEIADTLETVNEELDALTEKILGREIEGGGRRKDRKGHQDQLRGTLKRLGRHRQLVSKLRATLLGIGRIASYLDGECGTRLPDEAKGGLDGIGRDVASLDEFEIHLSDKVQFLLDATIGLISIEQNDIFRVLTVVSVVGVPPTLVASLYGMNFKHMPELDWVYGYPYGLALIAISAIAPLVYFKAARVVLRSRTCLRA